MPFEQFDRDKLVEAEKCFLNSAGNPHGQTVGFDSDVYHEVLALVKAALSVNGDEAVTPNMDAHNKALDQAAKIARGFAGQFVSAPWRIPEVIAEKIEALKQEVK